MKDKEPVEINYRADYNRYKPNAVQVNKLLYYTSHEGENWMKRPGLIKQIEMRRFRVRILEGIYEYKGSLYIVLTLVSN